MTRGSVPKIVGLICLCFCATAAWPASAHAQVVSARAGMVTRVEGEVLYRPRGDKDVQELEKGKTLGNGDVVMVVGKGRAEWTLNPDSYLQVGADSYVRVFETSLDHMHFDIERGEVFIIIRNLSNGASLVMHAPPGLLTVYKPGRYRFRVAPNGETEAAVVKGELRYVDDQGKVISVKKRRRVNFYKVEKKIEHGA